VSGFTQHFYICSLPSGIVGIPSVLGKRRRRETADARAVPLFSETPRCTESDEHVDSPDFEESRDGITLVQRYIKAPTPFITRVEFVGGKLVYAVRVDTSQGFELCPADACQVEAVSSACPTVAPGDKFQILPNFEHPLVPAWQAFLAANDIGIAGVEFIVDEAGHTFTYDINTNTNYNPDAETKDGRSGMRAIAAHLGNLLMERYCPTSHPASAA
jgi:hypothetical protein